MITRRSLYPLFLALLLCACEGTTTHEWKVYNATSGTIDVTPSFNTIVVHEPSVSIPPASEAVIGFEDDIRGGNSDASVHRSYLQRVLIISGPDTASKDGSAAGDWVSTSDHKRRMPSYWAHKHVLTVTDADLD